MPCDEIWSHRFAQILVDRIGWDEFVAVLEEIHEGQFFSCSKDWYNDSRFACKLKGGKRDLIIGWAGVHETEVRAN